MKESKKLVDEPLDWHSTPAENVMGAVSRPLLFLRKRRDDLEAGTVTMLSFLALRREDLPTLRNAVRVAFGEGEWT